MKKTFVLALAFVMLTGFFGLAEAAKLKLPGQLKEIERRAFYRDASLDEVVVPKGATSIGDRAFAYSGLNRIKIPDTVTYIADNAFEGVANLTIAAPTGSYAETYAKGHAGIEWEKKDDEILGNTVYFGRYEQDNNFSNGNERIQWRVLAKSGSYALLLSEYTLDAQEYDYSRTNTWVDCDLRYWLNSYFIYDAFSSAELDAIQMTLIDNSEKQGWQSIPGYRKYMIDELRWYDDFFADYCVDTCDRVFLLSLAEAYRYLGGRKEVNGGSVDWWLDDGESHLTERSYSLGANGTWYLRSSGDSYDFTVLDTVATAHATPTGIGVYLTDIYADIVAGVRPSLWVNLDSEVFE